MFSLVVGNYKKHYEEIIAYAKEMRAAGKKLASWGAGKKGTDFAGVIDPRGELISSVFDKDVAKWGRILPSGQEVMDFHGEANETDIVFLPMASFEAETIAILLKNDFRGDIISVQDCLLGGERKPLQRRLGKPRLKRIRKARIAALAVLYQPEPLVTEHIASYANKVDILHVWDNSSKENQQLFSSCNYENKLQYIHPRTNCGIGEPVNKVADEARRSGMDWMLTFDQDSAVSQDMVESMREYVESDMLDERAALVAPMVNEPMAVLESGLEDHLPYRSYVHSAITSGAMHRLDALCELRYRQEFFIDQLDEDFCFRAYLSGRNVVRLNHVHLHHQMDAGSFKVKEISGYRFYVWKYSPARYYYQYRNLLYSIKEYAGIDRDYVSSCQAGIKRLEAMVEVDSNKTANKYALQCAKEDFEAGIMGKWNGSE